LTEQRKKKTAPSHRKRHPLTFILSPEGRGNGEGENTPIPLLRRGGRQFPSKRGVIAIAIGVW